ncbi:VC0807 family protein [Saccharopolyspora sp. 5N708]|uniref:VC0807 family protein n=1 Tax=Saccharopolyspora sp. 5N708 TaxID=3457424 RepID=UPI003FCFE368
MTRPEQSPNQLTSTVQKFLKIFGGILVDVGLPMATYYGMRSFGFSEYLALLAGAGVAGVRLLIAMLWARRFEPFSGFMLATYLLSLPLALLSGDDRFLIVKDSFGTGITGLIFLATCFFGKPAMFYAAKRFRTAGDNVEAWEGLWQSNAGFRRTFTLMTVVWAAVLLTEAAVRVALAYVLSIDVMVALSSILGIGAIAVLLIWTLTYGASRQRRLQRLAQPAPAGRA